jgi:hypothetical protein
VGRGFESLQAYQSSPFPIKWIGQTLPLLRNREKGGLL